MSLDRVIEISRGPVLMIENLEGQVVGNSQALALDLLDSWSANQKFASYINELLEKIVKLEKECGRDPADY